MVINNHRGSSGIPAKYPSAPSNFSCQTKLCKHYGKEKRNIFAKQATLIEIDESRFKERLTRSLFQEEIFERWKFCIDD